MKLLHRSTARCSYFVPGKQVRNRTRTHRCFMLRLACGNAAHRLVPSYRPHRRPHTYRRPSCRRQLQPNKSLTSALSYKSITTLSSLSLAIWWSAPFSSRLYTSLSLPDSSPVRRRSVGSSFLTSRTAWHGTVPRVPLFCYCKLPLPLRVFDHQTSHLHTTTNGRELAFSSHHVRASTSCTFITLFHHSTRTAHAENCDNAASALHLRLSACPGPLRRRLPPRAGRHE